MPQNKLTHRAVETAKKPGLYGDGLGLYLQVGPTGTKSWLYRFMIDGRPRKMGLGPVHTISLAEARKRAAAARLQTHDRVDPIEARNLARTELKVASARAMTFKECAEAYIAINEAGWRNEKHRAQWRSTFSDTMRGKLTFPAATSVINDMPVSTVDTGMVLKCLEPIWADKPETASRLRGRIESVLDWATVREYRTGENPARWRGHLQNALGRRSATKKTKHHEAIAIDEMPAFMAELREKQGVSARALELTVLTAARTGEVIGAEWSEFDLAAGIWTVPAARMKAGREHRVPLSSRAVELLDALPRDSGPFVFPGVRHGHPISNMSMLELLRGMRGRGATVHGFRSTFRDWASERTSYPPDVAEMALAHAVKDKVEAAYRRGDLFDKRRALMADWAAFCAREVTL